MKRFLCVCMCVFILTISVITYLPVYAADNDFTLSIPSTADYYNIPASEVSSAISNRGDIYGSDHVLMWRYTPTSTYNWTSVDKALWDYTHFSDAQLSAVMQSSNAVSALAAFFSAASSNNNIFSSLLSGAGALVSGNSDLFTSLYDKFTGNKNYLDAIEYDSSTGELTLLADQVTALRKELKSQYYDLIGLVIFKPQGTPQSLLSSVKTKYEYEEDFQSDFADIKGREYVFSCTSYDGVRAVFRYVFSDTPSYFYWNGKNGYFEKNSNIVVMNSNFDILDWDYVTYFSCNSNAIPTNLMFNNRTPLSESTLLIHNGTYSVGNIFYYSDSNIPFKVWSSYEALYNYLHGSQNAYLSSKVEEAGEDIKMSINDMNDNIGSKIDDLIDSINNKKEGMSADELQDAIDKALDSISGKIDDIGDNTEETNNKLDALLEAISGTNEILMQILGVTTDIRDVVKTKDEEGNQYTMNDVKDCFNTMYNNLKYSILYGKNVTNNPDAANVSTAAYVSYSDVSTYADTSAETLDYKDGLFGKFPFSVPYQLYEWLQVLQTEEMVPQFTYNYGFLIGQKGKQEYDLTFDLSAYQSWADVLKSFLRLSFTLIMSVFIYNKFKGEI